MTLTELNRDLYLNSNRLSGVIPSDFGYLRALT
jgi:hypothetical protein